MWFIQLEYRYKTIKVENELVNKRISALEEEVKNNSEKDIQRSAGVIRQKYSILT